MRFSRNLLVFAALSSLSCDSTSPLTSGIGTYGGTAASDNNAARVIVPAGAIPSNVVVTVTPATTAPAKSGLLTSAAYEFGPTGTTFTSPVTITIHYDPAALPSNVPESSLQLYTLVGSEWTLVPGSVVDVSAHTVSGATTHFSAYAPGGVVAVSQVAISAPSTSVVAGATMQLSAVAQDASGNTLAGRTITWSTSDATRATVSSTGLVTGVLAGSVTISAASEGKSAVVTLTVTPPPVAVVAITPTTATVAVNASTTLVATTTAANGALLSGRTITWTSSDATRATVSSTGVVTGVAAGSAVITATSEGRSASATITVTPAPIATITVEAATSTIVTGVMIAATTIVRDANGVLLTGRVVTWTSSDPSIATVSSVGLITGTGSGVVTITATSEGKSGSVSITVIAPVATITITPATPTVAVGFTVALSAVPNDAAGNALLGRTVGWTSSNNAVATVSQNGIVTGVSAGTATIVAASENASSSVVVTVTGTVAPPAPVATVVVNPPTAALLVSATTQLSATTADLGGTVLTGRVITWTSSDPTKATVSANGLVTAVAAGSATITAASEGKSGTATITVAIVPVFTVTVTPPTVSVNTGAATALTAATRDANANLLTGRVVTWASSNPSAATVNGSGVVTGITPGTTTITATSEGKSGTSIVTVVLDPVVSVVIAPPVTNITVGATGALTATPSNVVGVTLTGRPVTWSSSDPAKVTVSATGVVSGVAVGGATITATIEGKLATATVNVAAATSGTTLPVVLSALSTADLHACGLTTAGAAYCWGSNGNGALGDGTGTDRLSPVAVGGGLTFASISTDKNLSCGIVADGTLYCWGAGAQLGQHLTPTSVAPGMTFASISVNSNHTCGVTTDGSAYCLGTNGNGSLGTGQSQGALAASTTFLPVAGGLHWKQVAAANGSTCGITTDGALYCWGNISNYNSGVGAVASSASPYLISSAVVYASMDRRIDSHTVCGLDAAGAVYCIGSITSEFGAAASPNFQTPQRVGGTKTFKLATHYSDNICGVGSDDLLYCWGSNGVGQLGQGTSITSSTTPLVVLAAKTFSTVDLNDEGSACAVAVDGTGYCWGYNFYGQIGDGTKLNRNTPTAVSGSLVFRVP